MSWIKRNVLVISIATAMIFVVLWWISPPCNVVKSAFLFSDLSSVPDRGIAIRSLPELDQAIKRYGIINCPSWIRSANFGVNEIIVFYPHADIIRTAAFQKNLFLVEIKMRDEIGVGAALLRGNIEPTPMFNLRK